MSSSDSHPFTCRLQLEIWEGGDIIFILIWPIQSVGSATFSLIASLLLQKYYQSGFALGAHGLDLMLFTVVVHYLLNLSMDFDMNQIFE